MATFGATTIRIVQADTGWIRVANMEEVSPLGGGTVLTTFGFQAAVRRWRGICTDAVRTALLTQYEANTVATLTDDDLLARSARIHPAPEFDRIAGGAALWRYTLVFVDRT